MTCECGDKDPILVEYDVYLIVDLNVIEVYRYLLILPFSLKEILIHVILIHLLPFHSLELQLHITILYCQIPMLKCKPLSSQGTKTLAQSCTSFVDVGHEVKLIDTPQHDVYQLYVE